MGRRRSRSVALPAFLIAWSSACGSVTTAASPTASPVAINTPHFAATARPTAPPVAGLAECAPPRNARTLPVVHHFSVSPDDIAVAANSRLWVTARESNQLVSMTTTGTDLTAQSVGGGPEGVASGDGVVYVAQQDNNRVVAVTQGVTTVLALPNGTRNAGIDGIAIDAAHHQLIVPDSPTGQLFTMSLPGSPAHLVASNLGRPVAATVLGANLVVASESAPGLSIVSPDGTVRPLGTFTNLDEVVAYEGLLYVADLGHNDVVAVDPVTGAGQEIVVNLPAPQGLAVTPSGTLEIIDATTNNLYSIPACGPAA